MEPQKTNDMDKCATDIDQPVRAGEVNENQVFKGLDGANRLWALATSSPEDLQTVHLVLNANEWDAAIDDIFASALQALRSRHQLHELHIECVGPALFTRLDYTFVPFHSVATLDDPAKMMKQVLSVARLPTLNANGTLANYQPKHSIHQYVRRILSYEKAIVTWLHLLATPCEPSNQARRIPRVVITGPMQMTLRRSLINTLALFPQEAFHQQQMGQVGDHATNSTRILNQEEELMAQYLGKSMVRICVSMSEDTEKDDDKSKATNNDPPSTIDTNEVNDTSAKAATDTKNTANDQAEAASTHDSEPATVPRPQESLITSSREYCLERTELRIVLGYLASKAWVGPPDNAKLAAFRSPSS